MILGERKMAMELPHHPGDHFETKTCPRLIDSEPLRKARAVVGDFDVKMSVELPGRDFNVAVTFRIGIFDCVGDQFVD